MSDTLQTRKEQIIKSIVDLFSDKTFSVESQAQALGEIADEAYARCEALEEQMRRDDR